jgi:hypothetical protein
VIPFNGLWAAMDWANAFIPEDDGCVLVAPFIGHPEQLIRLEFVGPRVRAYDVPNGVWIQL